jgi:DNA-3-methyladenine glycosylase
MIAGPRPLPRSFFDRPVLEVAPELIGCTFLFDGVGGRIVEVEAYRADDPASHSFRGPTARNAVMFGPPAHLYVYFTMGVHHCCNLVCEAEGSAGAVLLRALEPTHRVELMEERRGTAERRSLCSGPAKLTQALGIGGAADGLSACDSPVTVLARPGMDPAAPATWRQPRGAVASTARIGISRAVDKPWRFVEPGSAYLSRPFPGRTGGEGGGAPRVDGPSAAGARP